MIVGLSCGVSQDANTDHTQSDGARRIVDSFIHADTTGDWDSADELLWPCDQLGNPFCETATDQLKVVAGIRILNLEILRDITRINVEYSSVGSTYSVGQVNEGEIRWRFFSNVAVDTVPFNVIPDGDERLHIACGGLKPNYVPFVHARTHCHPHFGEQDLVEWRNAFEAGLALGWDLPEGD